MSQSSIWVLIASDSDAAIWTSQGGTSKMLQQIRRQPDAGSDHLGAFAGALMGELSRGTINKSCDGIILMADDRMLKALRKVMAPEVKKLMVAEIFASQATISAIPREKVSQTEWGCAA
jgi:protein required for attachment to host cells